MNTTKRDLNLGAVLKAAAFSWYPREESNLYHFLRTELLCPLSYRGIHFASKLRYFTY